MFSQIARAITNVAFQLFRLLYTRAIFLMLLVVRFGVGLRAFFVLCLFEFCPIIVIKIKTTAINRQEGLQLVYVILIIL